MVWLLSSLWGLFSYERKHPVLLEKPLVKQVMFRLANHNCALFGSAVLQKAGLDYQPKNIDVGFLIPYDKYDTEKFLTMVETIVKDLGKVHFEIGDGYDMNNVRRKMRKIDTHATYEWNILHIEGSYTYVNTGGAKNSAQIHGIVKVTLNDSTEMKFYAFDPVFAHMKNKSLNNTVPSHSCVSFYRYYSKNRNEDIINFVHYNTVGELLNNHAYCNAFATIDENGELDLHNVSSVYHDRFVVDRKWTFMAEQISRKFKDVHVDLS